MQILQQAQRLLIPLFQRPYVWGRVAQWEPLWEDITRMSDAVAANLNSPPKPHFLGAVVLQQRNVSIQSLPQRWVIDGQQRLTTLQIIIDAVQACMEAEGYNSQAIRLRDLIENETQYWLDEDDIFKLWPTNRDRDAYREVMGATPPINYDKLNHRDERIVQAHKYFSEAAKDYLTSGEPETSGRRADALEIALKQLLKLVVIDLDADEDAQEIFETLNSRGVKLSAADLIKNLIFQRLEDEKADSEKAYEMYWSRFETAFWEIEIVSGRLKQPRTAVFLNHFLIARTGEVVTASEVFHKFKEYVENLNIPTLQLLKTIHDVAAVYEMRVVKSTSPANELDPVELFLYRTQTMDVEVVKSIVIFLLDPSLAKISDDVVVKALTHIESWLVRRSLMRAPTKGFNRFIAQLLAELNKKDRAKADETIAEFLAEQTAESNYWPDNDQLLAHLGQFRMYRLVPRPRTRMILEALEDHARGYTRNSNGTSEQRCPRNTLTVEHVMPQQWKKNWPIQIGETEDSRNIAVQYLGNLTLLTNKLNSGVSNGPWHGQGGKREALHGQSSLLLNAEIENLGSNDWTVTTIEERTTLLVHRILEIWPAPEGHRVNLAPQTSVPAQKVKVADLISAQLLDAGDELLPTFSGYENRRAVLRPDGSFELDNGEIHASPSGAGRKILGSKSVAGWGFWRHQASGRTLNEIRAEYRSRFQVQFEEDEDESEADGE